MFAPESVYDASFDGGALASALADAAVDVTRRPEPSAGPFSMASALAVPAHDEQGADALARDLSSRADVVLLTLDWHGSPASARAAGAWLNAFAATGLHLDPLQWSEGTLPGALVFRRDAAALPSRVARAFARIIVERHAAAADRAAVVELRDVHERVAARADQLGNENRILRAQLDSLERENRSLVHAMRDVNTVLTDELEAVRVAEQTVADDISALHASAPWRFKMWLVSKVKRGRPS